MKMIMRMPLSLIGLLCLMVTGSTLFASDPGPEIDAPRVTMPDAQSASSHELIFQTDKFTGSFNYTVPIHVPPGRTGSAPHVELRYNSSAGNGWCGVGWVLDVGYIQRDNRHGVPVKFINGQAIYDDTKGFIYSIGGHEGRLVLQSGSLYRAEIEGNFYSFNRVGNTWVVTNKNGENYYFGETTDSLMQDATLGTYRWAINRFIDNTGNKTTYKYQLSFNYQYLQEIDYNENVNSPYLPASHKIQFMLSDTDRADWQYNYKSGYQVILLKTLSKIVVSVGTQRVYAYNLNFVTSSGTLKQLLSSVDEFGATDADQFPSYTFGYTVQDQSFNDIQHWSTVGRESGTTADTTWQSPNCTDGYGSYTELVDVNGDGLPDRIMRQNQGPYTQFLVQTNNGHGFDPVARPLTGIQTESNGGPYDTARNSLSASATPTSTYSSSIVELQDINGDALPDRVMRKWSTPFNAFEVQLNNGSGFSPIQVWNGVTDEAGQTSNIQYTSATASSSDGTETVAMLIDMNGDGLPDRVMKMQNSPWNCLKVQLNNGHGFDPVVNWGELRAEFSGSAYYGTKFKYGDELFTDLVDINGDGLPDRVMLSYYRDYYAVQFNNGHGFDSTLYAWINVNSEAAILGQDTGWNDIGLDDVSTPYGQHVAILADINGDGLPDRVMRQYYSGSTTASSFVVQLNTGNGFGDPFYWDGVKRELATESFAWNSPRMWKGPESMVEFVDIDGDGLPDRVMKSGTGDQSYFAVQLNKGPIPDLLNSVKNGIGGAIDVIYGSTATNADGSANKIPFPMHVVNSVFVNDGTYNYDEKDYFYRGGLYDSISREFRGFNSVEEDVQFNDGSVCATVSYYHQDGGQNDSANGEYLGNASHGKRGIPYKVETYAFNGDIGSIYKRVINKVEEIQPYGQLVGSYFPFISQTIEMDYEGSADYRARAEEFIYDSQYGNLIKHIDWGEIAPSVDFTWNNRFTDIGNDQVYTKYEYAASNQFTPSMFDKVSRRAIVKDDVESVVYSDVRYDYFSNGDLKSMRQWLDTSSEWVTTAYTYDVYGNLATLTDPEGVFTQFTVDNQYKISPATKTTAGNYSETYNYDPYTGNLLTYTDIKGVLHRFTYDNLYRLSAEYVSTTANGNADLLLKSYLYGFGDLPKNGDNYVKEIINDGGVTVGGRVVYTYFDGLGRVAQVREQAETANQFRVHDRLYVSWGLSQFESLPRFETGPDITWIPASALHGTGYIYDPIGRVYLEGPYVVNIIDGRAIDLKKQAPDEGDVGSPLSYQQVSYGYNGNPWVVVHTDAEGKEKRTVFDAFKRIAQVVETDSGVEYTTSYQYDNAGRLIAISDPNNNQITYTYDTLGRKASMTHPDIGLRTYKYDRTGQPTEQVDNKLNKIQFSYADPLRRIKNKYIYNPNGDLSATITYTYDQSDDANYYVAKGQLYKVDDREGSEKHGYDFRGRAIKTTRHVNISNADYTTQRQYDDADRVTLLTYPNNVASIQNVYDSGGNLQSVKSASGTQNAVTFYSASNFDALGRPGTIAYGNGLQTISTYYSASQKLQRLQATKPGGGFYEDLSYTYDGVGNIKSITDAVNTGAASAGISSATYDDLHRLTQVNGVATGVWNYQYDNLGNLTRNDERGRSQSTASYAGARPHAVKSYGAYGYKYDANGNMSDTNVETSGGKNYVYDEENRLILASSVNPDIGFTSYYGYAENGNRLWQWISSHGYSTYKESVTNIWIGTIYEERHGSHIPNRLVLGGPNGWTEDRILCHVYAGADRIATFEPVSTGHPEIQYKIGDHLGSSNIETDQSGNLLHSYRYTPYGYQRNSSQALQTMVVNPGYLVAQDNSAPAVLHHRFDDRFLDEFTGLYYFDSRYYDPQLGRFLQPDSMIPNPYDPQSLNPYTYAGNNPLKYKDPEGEFAFLITGAIGGVVGGVFSGVKAYCQGKPMAEVWQSAGKGAIVGFVAGATGGLAVSGLGVAATSYAGVAVAGAVGNTTQQLAEGAMGDRDHFSVTEVAVSTAAGPLIKGGAEYIVKPAAKAISRAITSGVSDAHPPTTAAEMATCSDGNCFVAGTLVKTEQGLKPIEQVKIGDLVWSFNLETQTDELQPVPQTYVRETPGLVEIEVSGERIFATKEHPFWVHGIGWVEAGFLQTGDILRAANAAEFPVTSVHILNVRSKVYNFEVSTTHNYFVAGHNILVHNTCPVSSGAGNGATKGVTRPTTTVLSDVTVISRGKIVGRGNVYLRETLEGIESGKIPRRDIFQNRPVPGKTIPELPVKARADYYEEFVHPTPGVSGAGSQRIVRGAGGELYYTPDHYNSFIPLN